MDASALASEFPAATREAWIAAVGRVLKGADFEKTLVGRTYDGLRIEPLYEKADSRAVSPVRAPGPWRVGARVDHPDPAEANALALADLEGGADALTLVLPGSAWARGFGLLGHGIEALDRALSGVMLDLLALRVEGGAAGREAAAAVLSLAERRGHSLAELDLDLGLDPIGDAARSGNLLADWDRAGADLAGTLGGLAGRGFTGRLVLADGRPCHEAGASDAQELAAVLGTAVAYLRVFEAGGHDLASARDAISFLLVADADEFLTVAKFRALRLLWAKVEAACGLEPEAARIHAETAWRSMTRRDPWVNLLRGTLAAFSAGIAGADAITVLPFTSALGLPDAFARRLARNTQLVLMEESNLWRVADPVAGSGAFEGITEALAAEAWSLFGEIEREGGIVGSLQAGALQGRIAAVRARREDNVATRRDSITGTSEFADLREAPVAVLLPSRPAAETKEADGAFPGLLPMRSAEPYERLRDRSDALLAQTGRRPRVFLANLGPVAAFSARASFARNAFEACGIESVTNDGFASQDAMVAAWARSGAETACLCSSDAIYAAESARAATALAAAGATRLYLAGRPGELENELRNAGVTGFIHVGADVPATLEAAVAVP